jgi:hypothetical protein
MAELLSGFACCDMQSKQTDEGTKYVLKFNPGRLVGAILLFGIGAGVKYIW